MYKPVQVTGMPKLDSVFKGGASKEKILTKMRLNPEKPTILFAPTFNPEFSLLTYMGQSLREYISEDFSQRRHLHRFLKYPEVHHCNYWSINIVQKDWCFPQNVSA